MGKGRLEAFSDGVIAIAITLMVLELKVPHAQTLEALTSILPGLFSYVLSFLYLGIYWNNHHHLFHAASKVSGMTLWANLHLLFWLTLVPFVSGWAGETGFGPWPVAAYGIVLLMAALSWQILVRVLVACHGKDSPLSAAIGRGFKEWVSTILYVLGIVIALAGPALNQSERWTPVAGFLIYAVVAAVWFVPDRRIERALQASHAH